MDGAALVNMLKPSGECTRFSDYMKQTYLPCIKGQLRSVQRLDVVWDTYIDQSLKASARCKRGKGVCCRVESEVNLPGNLGEFLKMEANKKELFKYLAQETISIDVYKTVISTIDQNILSTSRIDLFNISDSTHEEADTRLLLHVLNCANQGLQKLMIRTVDTDVFTLAVSFFRALNVQELWISFGTGKYFRYIAIHDIVHALGSQKSEVLHVFLGCHTTKKYLL